VEPTGCKAEAVGEVSREVLFGRRFSALEAMGAPKGTLFRAKPKLGAREKSFDGVPSAVESCAAVHCQFTPPPARWLAAIHLGSPSGPTGPGSP